ncbi:MAG: transglutaminase domain-containing protein [Hydrogenophaga sp.]
MKLQIQHTTTYRYSEPLLYTVQNLHLWPASSACQVVDSWDVQVPGALYRQPDIEGNRVHGFSRVARPEQALQSLRITAQGVVSTSGVCEFTDDVRGLPPGLYRRPTVLAEPHPRMALWALQVVPGLMAARAQGEAPSVPDLLALTHAVADKVRYRKGQTGVDTTALEAFDWGLGVCQDQAHVMVAVCRSIGLPARYVSGYFHAADEPELASHAWADVCLDEARCRWISLDVTHHCPTDERHVRLAAASDYAACLPVRGLRRGGGEESLAVQVRINALG